MYQQYYNILTADEYDELNKIVYGLKWVYGATSNINPSETKFWYSDLAQFPFFGSFFQKIESITNKKFKLIQVYANGQTLGQDGTWHYDSDASEGFTFIYYWNYHEDPSVVGETYFMVDDIPESIIPIQNSGVLFNHNVLHKGMAPRKEFNSLRVSIAFKLIEITNT